jgi:arsenate reductase (thioredoxin)
LRILFLCVANSARSQLAEGLARRRFPHAEVRSAGSRPGRLNPYAVAVMQEIGIDISTHSSKSVDDLPPPFLADLDYVITLCAEEVCPLLISTARKLHWPFPDPATPEPIPADQALRRFREARDAIARKLDAFTP